MLHIFVIVGPTDGAMMSLPSGTMVACTLVWNWHRYARLYRVTIFSKSIGALLSMALPSRRLLRLLARLWRKATPVETNPCIRQVH